MNKPKLEISAQKLRLILVSIIVMGLSAGAFEVWYLNSQLATSVAVKNDAVLSSSTSSANLEQAYTLKTYLDNHKEEVNKAADIVAQATSYKYQNQIVEDVTKYARLAGIDILGFNFPQDIASAVVDKTTGLKSLKATVTLRGPIKFTNYLLFLKYIEQNLTKIQITETSIAPLATDQNYIDDTSVGIQVYIR